MSGGGRGPPGCFGYPETQREYHYTKKAGKNSDYSPYVQTQFVQYGAWPLNYCFDPNKGVALKDMGWHVHGLVACQGDCDSDNDCKGELKCMHDAKPPGCTGTKVAWMDYCYDPSTLHNYDAKAPLFESLTFEDEANHLWNEPDVVDPEASPWAVTMSGKDLGILALFAINVVAILVLWKVCVRSRAGKKYQGVVMAGDTDMEEVALQ